MTDREKFDAWYTDFFGRKPLEMHWNIWQAALASQQLATKKSQGAIEADELLASGWTEHSGGRFPDNCHLRVVNDRGHYRQFFKLIDQPVEHGWIEWTGGECPCPEAKKIEIRFPDGIETWCYFPKGLRWKRIGATGDIIAYRVVNS